MPNRPPKKGLKLRTAKVAQFAKGMYELRGSADGPVWDRPASIREAKREALRFGATYADALLPHTEEDDHA